MDFADAPPRTFTQLDHLRLTRLAARAAAAAPLQELLDSGELVPATQVPPDLVTMRSQVVVQEDGDAPRALTLCYPEDAPSVPGFLSVLAPAGTALLGLRVGARAEWRTPDGRPRSARVVALPFQPEAAGDHTA